MRILVTGGAGFVGSHLVDRLTARGDVVTVLDDLSSGCLAHLAHARVPPRLVHGSVRDARLVDRLVQDAEQVFHLAAVVGVRTALEQSVRAMRVNAEGSGQVLDACAHHGVPVLYTSSSEVYGDVAGPLGEDSPVALGPSSRTRGGYACSKAYGEWLAFGYAREQGLPVVVARLFNVVGPRQSASMVVPRFVGQALRGKPLTIHGDGSQRRCFADVAEVADALLALAAAPRARGLVVNVGGPHECSVIELAHRVRAATGVDAPLVHVPFHAAFPSGGTDVRRRVPVLSRLFELTGRVPSRPFDDTLHAVVAEWRARLAVPQAVATP